MDNRVTFNVTIKDEEERWIMMRREKGDGR